MPRMPTQARFPEVPREVGHYESFYLKACHASEPLGVWIRYTVHKRPGGPPKGSLWCTLFDAAAGAPLASKVTLSEVDAGPGHFIRIGESRFEPGRVVGVAPSERVDAAWELEFSCDEPPFRHLPREWMYRAKVPRTKALSPYPAALFRGFVRAGERRVELDGWPGMVGHNWGAQHAERWIWMHGASFEGHPGAWLDAAVGRVKLGPLTTPWIANAQLVLEGERHRLGGPERIRSTQLDERPDGCAFTLTGSGATVRGRVGAARERFVGWVYGDPDGSEHHAVNCSIADMTLRVERPGRPAVELTRRGGAAYELGMREHDHGIPIQPFVDG